MIISISGGIIGAFFVGLLSHPFGIRSSSPLSLLLCLTSVIVPLHTVDGSVTYAELFTAFPSLSALHSSLRHPLIMQVFRDSFCRHVCCECPPLPSRFLPQYHPSPSHSAACCRRGIRCASCNVVVFAAFSEFALAAVYGPSSAHHSHHPSHPAILYVTSIHFSESMTKWHNFNSFLFASPLLHLCLPSSHSSVAMLLLALMTLAWRRERANIGVFVASLFVVPPLSVFPSPPPFIT